MKNIKKESRTFEDIKHIDENENEYWLARELQKVLDYTEWRKFENVINKAKKACENSKIDEDNHFVYADKMVQKEANNAHYEVGSKIRKTIKDLGGIMPEDLPTPEKSLKQLEKENKNMLKNK